MIGSIAVTRAKNWSNLLSYQSVGIVAYKWLTVGDERVCIICSALDGTVFYVDDAISQIEQISLTNDINEAKNIAPWIGYSTKRDKEGKDPFYYSTYNSDGDVVRRNYFGAEKLQDGKYMSKIGLMFGEAHGGCRCTTIPVLS